jgi:hypothetical protein
MSEVKIHIRTEDSGPTAPSNPSASPKRRSSSKKKTSARPLDVDFRPEGKTSLVDFAATKAPGSLAEKMAVSIFCVAEILGCPRRPRRRPDTSA